MAQREFVAHPLRFREPNRCSTIRARLSSVSPRRLHPCLSALLTGCRSPLLPCVCRCYLVFFRSGIKVSGGGAKEPSLLTVNTSFAGCPWQVSVSCLPDVV